MMTPYLDLILVAVGVALVGQSALFLILLNRQKKTSLNFACKVRDELLGKLREDRKELRQELESLRSESVGNLARFEQKMEQLEMRRSSRREAGESSVTSSRLDRKHQVFALARMGFDSRDISAKLRLSRAETELLIGLCGLNSAGETKHARTALR